MEGPGALVERQREHDGHWTSLSHGFCGHRRHHRGSRAVAWRCDHKSNILGAAALADVCPALGSGLASPVVVGPVERPARCRFAVLGGGAECAAGLDVALLLFRPATHAALAGGGVLLYLAHPDYRSHNLSGPTAASVARFTGGLSWVCRGGAYPASRHLRVPTRHPFAGAGGVSLCLCDGA